VRTSSTFYSLIKGKNLAWSQVVGTPRKPGKALVPSHRLSAVYGKALGARHSGLVKKRAFLATELLAAKQAPDTVLLSAAEKDERASEVQRLQCLLREVEVALSAVEQEKFAWEARRAAVTRRRAEYKAEAEALAQDRQRLRREKEARKAEAVAVYQLEKVCEICGVRYTRGALVLRELASVCSVYCREVFLHRKAAKGTP
jgi:hypothetical protein